MNTVPSRESLVGLAILFALAQSAVKNGGANWSTKPGWRNRQPGDSQVAR